MARKKAKVVEEAPVQVVEETLVTENVEAEVKVETETEVEAEVKDAKESIAAMDRYICLINQPQGWNKLTEKVLGRLPKEKRPPQKWFEENKYIQTLADIVSWCHYYTDGEQYYVLRKWEVSPYYGNQFIGEVCQDKDNENNEDNRNNTNEKTPF